MKSRSFLHPFSKGQSAVQTSCAKKWQFSCGKNWHGASLLAPVQQYLDLIPKSWTIFYFWSWLKVIWKWGFFQTLHNKCATLVETDACFILYLFKQMKCIADYNQQLFSKEIHWFFIHLFRLVPTIRFKWSHSLFFFNCQSERLTVLIAFFILTISHNWKVNELNMTDYKMIWSEVFLRPAVNESTHSTHKLLWDLTAIGSM